MGAGRAGPAARAWFLVCVSGGSCVCRLLGPAGVPCTEHRVTGNPASTPWLSPTPSVQAAYPWTGRGCVRRRATPLSCRSRACLGSAGGAAGVLQRSRGSAFRAGRLLCFWQPVLLSRRVPCREPLHAGVRGAGTGHAPPPSSRDAAGVSHPPCFRPVWRTVGPLLTSCHCNPFLSTPPFSSGVSTPQRQSRRPPGVHVKPSLAAVSVVAGSRSGRGGRVAGTARAALWPLAELVRGARGRGGLECRPRAPGPWWTSESEALAQAPSRQALACWRVDRAISSLAVVGTVLYALTETWKVRRPATKSSPGPRGGFRKCPSRPSGLALWRALPGGGVLPPSRAEAPSFRSRPRASRPRPGGRGDGCRCPEGRGLLEQAEGGFDQTLLDSGRPVRVEGPGLPWASAWPPAAPGVKRAPSGDRSAVISAAGWTAAGPSRGDPRQNRRVPVLCAFARPRPQQPPGVWVPWACGLWPGVVSCLGLMPGSSAQESCDLGHVLCPDCTVVSSVKLADDIASSRKGHCEEA